MLFLTFTPSFRLLYVITTVCWRIGCQIPTTNILLVDIIFLLSALHQPCIRPCHRMVRVELARRKVSTLEMPSKNPTDDLSLPTRIHLSKANLATPQILAPAIQIPSKGAIATTNMLLSHNRLNPRQRHTLPSSLVMHPTALLSINPFLL